MKHLSVQVGNKQAITRTVNSALITNTERLAQELGTVLFPDGVPEDVNLVKVLLALASVLQRDMVELAEADRLVATELLEDQEARKGREAKIIILRENLIATRGVVENGYGPQQAAACGLAGQVPENPEALVQAALNAADKLPALAKTPSRTRYISFDAKAAAADIRAMAVELDATLKHLSQEQRETQNAQKRRNQAHQSWDGHYDPVAGIAERLFELIDDQHTATRIRPTSRRRAGMPEPEDLELEPGTGGTTPGTDGTDDTTTAGGDSPIIPQPPTA